jgi:hypothetical protein
MTRIEAFEAALTASQSIPDPQRQAQAVADAWQAFLPTSHGAPKQKPQPKRRKPLTGGKA